MEGTKQTISKVLNEIEKNDAPGVLNAGEGKSVDQVLEILLGEKGLPSSEEDSAYSEPVSDFGLDELKRWRDRNNEIYQINYYHPVVSSKPAIGKVIILVKKFFRKLLKSIFLPIIMEQNDFNGSVTASINALYDNTERLIRQMTYHESMIEMVSGEVSVLQKEAFSAKPSNDRAGLDRVESTSEGRIVTADAYQKIDYAKFEDHFRGSREEVREKQKMYLPYLTGKRNVIDLGCGRGEFLELLKETGIRATGIDIYPEFVEDCNARGLHVIEADGIRYIRDLDDESVDGIVALQLAEHLQTEELVELCRDSYKKLTNGGILIMETPNPGCLSIYTNAFYLDPSHTKPVHPKMLEYFLREAGFNKIEIVYTQGSKIPYDLPLVQTDAIDNLKDVNDGIYLLSNLIFGSQDYAIVAYK